jgi:hypothetical protein
MTFPLRFKWIKWNASRLTDRPAVRQTGSTREAPTNLRTADTVAVRQPPLHRRRSAPYTRDARVRAESWAGARAAAHYASRRLYAGVGDDREVAR